MQHLIKNGRIDGQLQDILIEDGKVIAIEADIQAPDSEIFDAQGKDVLPGLVDVHVHFREPGFEYKETIASGSKASARGGFTTVIAMPNLNPVPDTADKFAAQVKRNTENSVIKTYQFAPISGGLIDDHVTNMAEIAQYQPAGFTNDGHGVQTSMTMLQAMRQAKNLNLPIVAHIEDDSLVNGGAMNAGAVADRLGLPGMESLSESTQLARDLVMVKQTGVHYHVAHISTKESVEMVRQAKREGLNVTAEVSPHHVLLDETMVDFDNPFMKMNPPLRATADRLACIAGLMDGTIDMVATDHAPHSVEEKSGSMKTAAFGIVGIETSLALMYTHFVKSGLVNLATLLEWMAVKPAQAFNLSAGKLAVGTAADFTIVDFDEEYEIKAEDFISKGTNSPFLGEKVFGQVLATFVDGQMVYSK